jgi:dynein heavy chain
LFRWDTNAVSIVESRQKDLYPMMPIMFIKAITLDKQELRSLYDCPVYKTRQRGPTYVWTFNLKTKEKPAKWVLAGVALLLQI